MQMEVIQVDFEMDEIGLNISDEAKEELKEKYPESKYGKIHHNLQAWRFVGDDDNLAGTFWLQVFCLGKEDMWDAKDWLVEQYWKASSFVSGDIGDDDYTENDIPIQMIEPYFELFSEIMKKRWF